MAHFTLGGKKGDSQNGISNGARTQLGGFLNNLNQREAGPVRNEDFILGGIKRFTQQGE